MVRPAKRGRHRPGIRNLARCLPSGTYQNVTTIRARTQPDEENARRGGGPRRRSPTSDAELVVDTVLVSIVETLHRGEKVELRGFGSFRLRQRNPHTAATRRTGEAVDVPSRRVPYFKPGKELKALINRELPQVGAAATAGAGNRTHS